MNKHPFVYNVNMALVYANVKKDTCRFFFVREIRHAFIQKNVLSMDREQCDEIGYVYCSIDRRFFY